MIHTSIGDFETEANAILAFEEKLKPKEPPKSKLLFLLTMPHANSWNGKWSGANTIHAIVKDVKAFPECKEGSYSYHWDDGWVANIEVRKVTAKEANKYKKLSGGFWGYDWMVQSILECGKICLEREEND